MSKSQTEIIDLTIYENVQINEMIFPKKIMGLKLELEDDSIILKDEFLEMRITDLRMVLPIDGDMNDYLNENEGWMGRSHSMNSDGSLIFDLTVSGKELNRLIETYNEQLTENWFAPLNGGYVLPDNFDFNRSEIYKILGDVRGLQKHDCATSIGRYGSPLTRFFGQLKTQLMNLQSNKN